MITKPAYFVTMATALLVSACAVGGKPVLTRSGPGLAPGAQVSIATSGAALPDEKLVGAALHQALLARGYKVGQSGRYELSYAVAVRPASTGLAPGDAGKDPDWISPPQKGLPLQRCKASSTRVSLVAYEVATSSVAYRATGEQQGCKLDRATTESLVKAMLAEASAQ